ncbi:hypothetical protein GCM10007921_12440 [Tritonibacter mobilis]|nr:hypothetical protein GCM10007921_12440 [Tritonibacter mobilis]SDX86003.1 hypothetical protein SAMN05444385_11548 [Tritonibacter mobilis]
MFLRLSTVSALDIVEPLRAGQGRSDRKRGGAACPPDDRYTVIRAHHQATGAKRKFRSWVSAVRAVVFTTKIHLLCSAAGLPMRTEITAGQTSDYLGFDLVMADNLKNARRVATRYDKITESFLGFVDITSIRLWTRHLST